MYLPKEKKPQQVATSDEELNFTEYTRQESNL